MISINNPLVKNIFRVTSLLLLIAGCIIYASARQEKVRGGSASKGKLVIITFEEVSVDLEGKETRKALIVSELTVGKGWVSTRYPAGSSEWVQTTASENGQEVVKSNGQKAQRAEHPPNAEMWDKMSTVEFYKSHPKYVEEDPILGYQAFKLKQDMPDGSSREITYAPEFGPFHLRYVVNHLNGTKVIQRAIKIEIK